MVWCVMVCMHGVVCNGVYAWCGVLWCVCMVRCVCMVWCVMVCMHGVVCNGVYAWCYGVYAWCGV